MCIGWPLITPNETRVPWWPSRSTRSPLASPPTESTAAAACASPVAARTRSFQPSTEVGHVHAARPRQHRQRLADGPVGGVLHDPLARLDVQELQQHQRAQRHRDQLCGHLVGDGVRHRNHHARRCDERFGPGAVHRGGGHALADPQALDAFAKRIDALSWMSPQTKAHAKAKVAGLTVGMGYPEKWRDYTGLEIRRDDALGNAQRAELFEYQRNIAKLGKAVDHSEWAMLPQTINAMNVPLENRLVFPAAILQPPFFDGAADDAVNYGAIGAVIGHEISHGFDNAGALFDETGKLHNWWTAEDLKQFNAAGDALAAQFSSYEPFPGVHVNGKLTLGENIADVAGLGTAYDAYQLSLQGKPGQTLEGFTPDQRFFLGFAQAWRSKSREQALRNSLLTDVHAPGQFRALTVRNIDAWYPAFEVKEGQKLYLAPDKRVKVW
ncbi:hypothetical protein G6F57_015276 [Rhizopus arrhizus]|nr:hypothetical protein G6F57_015276 [Rhizopus arrhizus]